MTKIFFESIIILRFDKTKVGKEEFYVARKQITIWDDNIDNVTTSKLIDIGYLGQVIKPLVLILSKMSGYVETFKIKVELSQEY